MIKWQKLNKEELEKLKIEEMRILVIDENCDNEEFAYDIIYFLSLIDLGLKEEEMNNHWMNLMQEGNYDYDDQDILNHFTHYAIIKKPEDRKGLSIIKKQ